MVNGDRIAVGEGERGNRKTHCFFFVKFIKNEYEGCVEKERKREK